MNIQQNDVIKTKNGRETVLFVGKERITVSGQTGFVKVEDVISVVSSTPMRVQNRTSRYTGKE